eukprot:CAMPEP_0174827248 /NCGR_PEP_ID=MMETSP1114-20130205/582_1 /TAXON_ID=312471 /ORGANISM="Neobodo designis, Strain CCAP 1951/1" /LENGTH=42 /DNA_ID= /DNA_START= /DNA_END= /DNA_ORIENTATION=
MKCATGGKCKVCGELFGELKRVDPMDAPAPGAVAPEESAASK